MQLFYLLELQVIFIVDCEKSCISYPTHFIETQFYCNLKSKLPLPENLRFDQFCVKTKELFGPSIKSRDLKSIYFKITTNPDARVDWSEVSTGQ